MEKNQLAIKKVHLSTLMEMLTELYNKGVDYIDILGTLDDTQDSIGIGFCKEYMNEEFRSNFDKMEIKIAPKNNINVEPSDEDFNQLI